MVVGGSDEVVGEGGGGSWMEETEKEKLEEAGSWRRRGEKVRERDLERENKDGNEKQDTCGSRRLKNLFIGSSLSTVIFLNRCYTF